MYPLERTVRPTKKTSLNNIRVRKKPLMHVAHEQKETVIIDKQKTRLGVMGCGHNAVNFDASNGYV